MPENGRDVIHTLDMIITDKGWQNPKLFFF